MVAYSDCRRACAVGRFSLDYRVTGTSWRRHDLAPKLPFQRPTGPEYTLAIRRSRCAVVAGWLEAAAIRLCDNIVLYQRGDTAQRTGTLIILHGLHASPAHHSLHEAGCLRVAYFRQRRHNFDGSSWARHLTSRFSHLRPLRGQRGSPQHAGTTLHFTLAAANEGDGMFARSSGKARERPL